MTSANSIIEPTFDLSANGKYLGYLKLPHSVHRSAYGFIPIPIVSVKNGTGPTILLSAGVHGDEFEGQIALTKLVKEIKPAQVNGQVIILTMTNFPAAKAGLRTSPIDDLNLNREFPGDPHGTPTSQIAHFVETVLMSMADYSLDIHSGGTSLHYLPTILYRAGKVGDKQADKSKELVTTFGAPYAIAIPSNKGIRTTMAAAERQSAIGIGGEFGGSGTVSSESLQICELGIRRLLHHLKIWSPITLPPSSEPEETVYLNSNSENLLVYADQAGLFEPAVQLGDMVVTNQIAGYLHHPDTPWLKPEEVRFKTDGLVLAKRIPSLSERGDCLFHLGNFDR